MLKTVFDYETPKYHKQNNELDKLNELMRKIYGATPEIINERIDAINVD